jgi:ribosome biogenesis GTPase
MLEGNTTVFVGHSGVGKTTIINQIAPNFVRATGIVNKVTGKGRHTSSSAHAIRAQGGWLVDTPGIRSFGLSNIDAEGLLRGFSDLSDASIDCPRGCTHLADSPDCSLDKKMLAGEVSELRLDSLRRLLESLSSVD